MERKSDDRRVRKTKKALREGLAVLLTQKNIKDVSVRELTDLVDLHRGTFYLHYKDIYDLYTQIEQEIVDEVCSIFDQYHSEKSGRPFPLIFNLIKYCEDNSRMCQMLLGESGDHKFIKQLSDIILQRCLSDWMELYKDANPIHYDFFGVYVVSGCIGVIRRWLETGMQQSSEQLAEIIEKMAIEGVSCLKRKSL